MQYQLVIQFPETLEGDLDKLFELEDRFEGIIGSDAEVDGHDIGSGEMNIFITTTNPEETFGIIKNILKNNEIINMKAAYRNIENGDFTCLHPDGLSHFNVI